LIVLGKIVEPHGVGGWVRVHPFADDLDVWGKLTQCWLSLDDTVADEAWKPRKLTQTRVASGKLLAKLDGVDDRTGSEALKGWFVAAPRAALPEPAADEYYWDDLVGLAVSNLQGDALGAVTEMIATGANDVMVVVSGDSKRLIPFLGHVIQKVDLAGRKVLVDWGADW
jgi:16S rRNA processing protein RimM